MMDYVRKHYGKRKRRRPNSKPDLALARKLTGLEDAASSPTGLGSIARWFVPMLGRRAASRPEEAVLRRSAYFPLVRARESRSEVVYQSFPRRGRYRLGGFHISTRFPFGFFRRELE